MNARVDWILLTYNRRLFRRLHGASLAYSLEAIVFRDVDDVLVALADAARSVKPDRSVYDERRVAILLVKKAMWQIAFSPSYVLARRRTLPPESSSPSSESTAAVNSQALAQDLGAATKGMTAREAAIYLGNLAGLYVTACPAALYEDWMRKVPRFGKPDPSPLFRVVMLQGGLLMRLDP